ncbi:hypothetical protein PENTCL1PPCAC_27293, partial [Pristionchus entomophagus]
FQFLEISRYFQFAAKEPKIQKNSADSTSTYNPSTGFRSRYGSDASTLTISSQKELLGRISQPQYPVVAHKWSSRGLMLMAAVHTAILFADIFLLNTTDSRRWRNENVQAYTLFSLLIFLTNFSMPLVIAAVLLKGSKALTLFASFSVFWTSFAYGVIIMAYSEFDNPISSQPAGSLTMLTLLLTMLDCLALVTFFFTRFIRYKTFAGFFTPKINLVKEAKKQEPKRKFGLILPMTVDEAEMEEKSSISSTSEQDTLTSVTFSVIPVPVKFTRQRSKIQPPINYI